MISFDKRKLFGTILGIIIYALIVTGLTYAMYTWKSGNTLLTLNIKDAYFYCESGVDVEASALTPTLDYRTSAYQTFKVNNVGREDTRFSLSLNVTSIDDSLKTESFKYKLVVDKTGGSNDCSSTSNNNCFDVENGEGDFSQIKVGMNNLVPSIVIPNNSRYQYYLFMYIDGSMENDVSMQNSSITSILDVCEVVVFLDYNGGNVDKEFLKVTNTYSGLPSSPTRDNSVVTYNSNGGSTVNSDTVTYSFQGWYKEKEFTTRITSDTEVTDTTNHTLYAKWNSSKTITLPTPTRTGYTFGGWYSDEGLTKLVGQAGSNYDPEKSITLYAKWTANVYNISYTLDGGTKGSNAPAKGTYDNVVTIDNPTRTGYSFQGWSSTTINTSTAKYGSSSSNVSTSWSSTSTKVKDKYFKNLTPTSGATVTLIANWQDTAPPTCTVSTPATVKYGNTTTSTVTCTDNASMSSQNLTTSSFASSNTSVATIQSVSAPTAVTGGYKYTVTLKGVGAGTYTLSINAGVISDTAGNKNEKTTSAQATIEKETTATTGSCASLTYNGESQTLASGGSYVTYTNNTRTNAGSQTVTVTSDNNHTFSDGTTSKTLSCSISKRNVTYKSDSAEKVYNGTALTKKTATLTSGTLVSGHTATFEITGTITNVGQTPNTLSSVTIKNGDTDVTSNYNITKQNGTLTITSQGVTIPTTANYCSNPTYNGSSQTITKTAASQYTFSANTGTNAGSYTVTATLKNTTNYTWSDGTTSAKTFTCPINKKAITITAKDQTVTYGTAITKTTAQVTVETLVSNHTLASITLTQSTTNATTSGTITPSAAVINDASSNAVTSNYDITYKTGKLVINMEDSRISLSEKTATYTGLAISANTASVTGTTGSVSYTYYTDSSCSTQTPTTTGASAAGKAPIDVGTYYVKATAVSDGNYSGVSSSCVTHTINKKSITVEWGSTTSFTYDGTAKGPSITTPATGVNSEKLNLTRTTETNVGSYTSTASCSSVTGGRTKCSNYSLASTTKSYSISYKTYTITLDNKSATSAGTASIYGRYANGIYLDSSYTKLMSTSANNITVPSKTGYTFGGYYTEENGAGTKMISNTGYITTDLTNTKYNANVTLYAKWSINNYTLTYDCTTNGGSTANTENSLEYNSSVDLSKTCTKSGYTFLGWNTTKNATSQLSSYTMPASNTTIYGIFRKSVSARFIVQDSDAVTASGTSAGCSMYNNATSCSIRVPTLTAKTDYTAVGWNTDPDAKTSILASGGSASLSSNETYYSITSSSVTGTFYYANSSGNQTSTTATCKKWNGATSCNFTLPSAVSSSSGPSSTTYKGVASATSSTTTVSSYPSTTTKYYAVYEKSITATFYYNSSTTSGSLSVSTATSVAKRTATTNGTTYSVTNPNITVPSAVSSSVGQYQSAYRGVSTATGSMTTSTPTTSQTTYTYYAVYSSQLTIYYPNAETTCTTASGIAYRNEYFTSTDKMNWIIGNSNTATSNLTTISGIIGTLNGFNATANTTSSSTIERSAQSSEKTLYAITKTTESVRFVYYDGTAKVTTDAVNGTRTYYCSNTTTAAKSDSTVTIPSAVKENRTIDSQQYSYRGLTASDSDTSPEANATVASSATTAYSYWHASYSSTITYTFWNGEGFGSVTSPLTTINSSTPAYMNSNGDKIGTSITMAAASVAGTKSGYTLVGWNTAYDGTGSTTYTAGTTYSSLTVNRSVYSKFRINVTKVQYHMNGGSWSTSTDSRLSYSGNYVTYNGSTIVNKYNNGTTGINLPNWDYSGWINILRANYMAKTGAEWCIMSGTTLTSTCFNDDASDITAKSLCDSTNGDCTVTLGVNWVAANYKINSSPNYYKATLQEAVSVASAGNTITVLQNNTDTSNPVINKNLTLNTNSKTITKNTKQIAVTAGTLTINGSGTIIRNFSDAIGITASSSGSISTTSVNIKDGVTNNTNALMYNSGSGTITLGSSTVLTARKSSACNISGSGQIKVAGATIANTSADTNGAILIYGNPAGSGSVTISSGTITQYATNQYAVRIINNGGLDLTISGGTITAPKKTVSFTYEDTYDADLAAEIKFNMSGGTIKATSSSADAENYALSLGGDLGDLSYTISGGTIWHSGSGGGLWVGKTTDSDGNITSGASVNITGTTSQVYIYANGGNAALTVNGGTVKVRKARIEGNSAYGLYVNSGGWAYINNSGDDRGIAANNGTFISSVSNHAVYVTGNAANEFKFGGNVYRTTGYAPTAVTGGTNKYAIACGANTGICNFTGGRVFTKTSTSYLLNSNVSKYAKTYATNSSSGTNWGTKYKLSFNYRGYYTAN